MINMAGSRWKAVLKENLIFYAAGFVVLSCLKLFYSRAGSDELRWILAPTARWAGSLGGISFAYEAQQGYVNHELRFIIAASCSGVQFMLVSMAALIYGCIHRMKTGIKRLFGWREAWYFPICLLFLSMVSVLCQPYICRFGWRVFWPEAGG